MATDSKSHPDRVAIVGMACQLPPEINSPHALWEFCVQARCSATAIPESRHDARNSYHPSALKPGHHNVSAGSYISRDVSLFDAPYFQVTEAEAVAMDPQHRLLLETTVHALEDAGVDMNNLAGRNDVGVFMASSNSEYETRLYQDPHTASRYTALGTASAMFANRVSYFFNFRGPSINVDTACSSALTALHFAVESIRKGECAYALVGGSFLQFSPSVLAFMGNLGALSKDGISYSFDSRANGYGRGDGVCCIVLKSEREADACRDNILAWIRQTGINHCGRSQGGIMVPDGAAQLDLLHQVYRTAQLQPEDTDFVEAHGTGTARGDPVEANSIISAFAGPARGDRPLYLGSIKSNLGHLENASGLLSIIKCVLMLQHKTILPNANFEKLNSAIQSQNCNLIVPTECVPWSHGVRRASINNFGFGGSNSHVILEEFIEKPSVLLHANKEDGLVQEPSSHLFITSAKDTTALASAVAGLAQYIGVKQDNRDEVSLADLSYTLCSRRTIYEYRFACSASSLTELGEKLRSENSRKRSVDRNVASFAFTGQGAAWPQMGVLLMQYPEFARQMQAADDFLRLELGSSWSLLDELAKPSEKSRIHDAIISQPAATALQLALVSLLRSWGIEPLAVCGHSSGEIAAAYTAGLIDFKGSLALAYFRGKATSLCNRETKLPKGGMIAVGASALEVEPLVRSLRSGLAVVACYNSSRSVTVSGDTCAILELQEELTRLSIFSRVLRVNTAYHSEHMVPFAHQYLEHITPWLNKSQLSKLTSKAIFFSSVTGSEETASVVQSPWYWTTNLVCPVKFDAAMKGLLDCISKHKKAADVSHTTIEIGPHGALAAPIQDILDDITSDSGTPGFQYLSAMKRSAEPRNHLLSMVSRLLCLGHRLKVNEISRSGIKSEPKLLADLPNYPFNRDISYWHRSRATDMHEHGGSPWNVMLGHKVSSIGGTIEYRNLFTLDDIPWLRDHVINGKIIFPLAGYISMAIEGLAMEHGSISPGGSFRIREMVVGKALPLIEGEQHEMSTILRHLSSSTRIAEPASWYMFEVWSWSKDAGASEHCKGMIKLQTSDPSAVGSVLQRRKEAMSDLCTSIESRSHRKISATALYRQAALGALTYGPSFRLLTDLATGPNVATGIVKPTDTARLMPEEYENRLIVHPTFLDACLHTGFGLLSGAAGTLAKLRAHVPTFIQDMRISTELCGRESLDHVRTFSHNADADGTTRSVSIDVIVCADGSELPLIEINALRMVDVSDALQIVSDVDIINPAKLEWLDHMDFISSDILAKLDVRDAAGKEADRKRVQDVERMSLQFMEDALQSTPVPTVLPHLDLMREWMAAEVAKASSWLNESRQQSSSAAEEAPPDDEAFFRGTGPQIGAVLRGEVDALSVLKANGLQTVYEDCFGFHASAALLAQSVGRLSLQNPSLRILEVGAGTGAYTSRVLEQLSTSRPSRFSHYCYTDISPVFLDPARAKFATWEHKMSFETLDLGHEAVTQGFDLAGFDLVIAADVIHAIPCVGKALSTIRSLLKPHGALAMVELSRPCPSSFPWAMLQGWWLRPTGPVLSEKQWHEDLVRAGFSGIDAYVRDMPDGYDTHCTMWSHVLPGPDEKSSPEVVVIGENSLARHMRSTRQLMSGSAEYEELVNEDKIDTAIIVEHASGHAMIEMCQERLTTLQKICSKSKGILWIVRSSGDNIEAAAAEFVFGIARTLRKEYTQLKLVVLQLVDAVDDATAANISEAVLDHAFIDRPGIDESEVDFKLTGECLQYPRLIVDDQLRDELALDEQHHVEEIALFNRDAVLQAAMGTVGLFDTLRFEPCSSFHIDDPLGDDELMIQICATGANFKDVLIALGRVPGTSLGIECSGTVIATGRLAAEQFRIGDRVLHWGERLFASHARCHALTVAKVPAEISLGFAELASIPIVFATAYEALIKCARLQPGEKLLIHAAAGGLGQAAIQLAQWVGGIDIYCTVGSPEKRDMLIERYGIDETHIFSSRSAQDLADGLRLSGCMDVVLNSLSDELLRESWRSMAPFGRFIEVGKRDALINAALEMAPLDKAVTYAAVDLALLIEHRTEYSLELLKSVLELFRAGELLPVSPVMAMPVSDLCDGLRLLQSGKHKGKVVITNDRQARVQALRVKRDGQRSVISPEASYLITGGTGGLGRALAAWFMQQGAKHLILASRTGTISNPAEAEEIKSLAATNNAQILIPECDVTLQEDLLRVLSEIEVQGMPRVRGVVHAAMVLRDALFESTTPEDWEAVSRPKVQGVLNLHNAFPGADDLDFFLCLSSVAALSGNIGQAHYSGSNAAVDAVCNWRGRQGLPATSVNLPVISDAGYVAEAVLAQGNQINDKLYRAAMTMAQLEQSIGVLLNLRGGSTQVALGGGLSKTQEGMDWLADAGKLFEAMRWNLADRGYVNAAEHNSKNGETSVRSVVASLTDIAEKKSALQYALMEKIASMLRTSLDNVQPEKSINDLGLDSLVAVELRNWIVRELDANIPIMDIVGCATMQHFLDLVTARSSLVK